MVQHMNLLARCFAAALALMLTLPWSPAGRAAPPKAEAKSAAKPVQQKEGVVRLGGAQGWEAYSDTEKGHKICYLVGEPSKSEPAGAKRSKVSVSITHRPAEKISNEVSFNAGYLFKEGSDAELMVDNRKFSLFTNKDAAWARDPATDKAVVEALAKGKQAVFKGTSARGTETTDTYSLAGLGQALGQIDKTCGVKR
ncbi:MAG TPA: invasion associated locus B family protein [Stellaceae bacterium]|nr:invasion associated locus B family protein [Stellaceae bacterium]